MPPTARPPVHCFELLPPLDAEFSGPEAFDRIVALRGDVIRQVKNRRTLSFSCRGHRFFAKIHQPTSRGEIVRTWTKGHRPVLSARREWEAMRRLEARGVATLPLAGFGERGSAFAGLESFLLTRALTRHLSLEELLPRWTGLDPLPKLRLRRRLAESLGRTLRAMHGAGVNHRDCYLCHFLVEDRNWNDYRDAPLELVVIDLHRAQIRGRVPNRWLIKDLGSLHFSAREAGLSVTDHLRFLRAYLGGEWKENLRRDRRFWYRVLLRSMRLSAKWDRHHPDPESGP